MSAIAATAIAVAFWGPAVRKLRTADCATTRLAIAEVLRTEGPRAAAESARLFAAKCPAESEGGLVAARLLALAGDFDRSWSAIPLPYGDREALAAAALDFARRDWKRAEEAAEAIAKKTGPEWPQAACLAAAAALNQDRHDLAEAHLAGAPTDCARVLRAAALAQRGERREARALLAERASETSVVAARESALGILDLLAGDMEAAAADALAASSAADADPLSPRPWIWYLQSSPRGAGENVLRVTGPFDDPGVYTKVLEGDCARVRGNLELAMKRYEEARARGGRTAIADLRAAAVLVQQGRPQLARGRLARALEAEPGWAPALVALALIDERSSPDVAAVHAAAALETEPANRDAQRIAGRGK